MIYGRSDSTINRHGVRVGTSEIYRAIEMVSGVSDSLVIELPASGEDSIVVLFVVLESGAQLDDALKAAIGDAIRVVVSPRHVPDVIEVIAD